VRQASHYTAKADAVVEEFPIVELTTGEVVDEVEELTVGEFVDELAVAGDGLAVVEVMAEQEAVEVEELTTVELVEQAVAPLRGEAGQVEKGTCSL
jgi:hypothetical protein